MTLNMTLGQLAEALGATLKGPEALQITGLATLQEAGPGQLSFLANPQYRKFLPESKAAAVLLKAADAEGFAGHALIVADPYLAYARVSHLFDPKPRAVAGVHPRAVVAEDAQVDASASIGACAVIECGAQIGAGVTIGAHCVVGARSVVGEGGWLAPRVTLYHDVQIGKRVVIQSGAVIGGVLTSSNQTPFESLQLLNIDPLLVQLPMDHDWSMFAKSFSLLNFWVWFLSALGWKTWFRTGWGQALVVALLPSIVIYGAMALFAII